MVQAKGARRQNAEGGKLGAEVKSDGAQLDVIAIQLKASREARGLSVSQLHASTGIARTALHDYEAGRYKPGANEIRKLCEALGITPNKLLTGRDNPESPKTPLEEVFGAGSEHVQIMKAGQLLLMLPPDERDAFYKLLLGLVSARYSAEKLKESMEQIEVVAGVLNLMGARVTDPDAALDVEHVKKHMAQINPELVSEERAERVRKERAAKQKPVAPPSKD
ncbi:helix-turn-helix domain-containing protein [Burkholderia contaminans]|uniref:helix-turn-helix domain-containing protein n=1 Tax=Burkholderia contaminans TaxID=488447 RepID=UPI001CF2287A|nr:helix-turn-helix transcriptional regulator [Burkholderia contaminans]MCA7919462.1 helix-turn-helix domain-containing protein [Burkholderia contaminans]UUX37206.1 helix-turn-helix domain-containing protein [Burkholderia contaminans]